MTKHIFWLLLTLSALAFAESLDPRSDSGIYGPSYDEQLARMANTANTYPDMVEMIDYGKSVEGRTLRMLVVGKKNLLSTNPRTGILITGAIHGNEYLSIVDRLPEEFIGMAGQKTTITRYINEGGVFMFVPIINPDGYEARMRYNANGKDLNRDWDVPPAGHKGFREPETASLRDAIVSQLEKRDIELHTMVDYHCCIGALLLPWSYTSAPIASEDLKAHKAIGKMADSHLDIAVGTTAEILGYYAKGTTKDYYYSVHNVLSFTYEGRYGKEDKYYQQHVFWWEQWIGSINDLNFIRSMQPFHLLG